MKGPIVLVFFPLLILLEISLIRLLWILLRERRRPRPNLPQPAPGSPFPSLPPATLPSVYDKKGVGPGPIEYKGYESRSTVLGTWRI